jgi:hypothetical protein
MLTYSDVCRVYDDCGRLISDTSEVQLALDQDAGVSFPNHPATITVRLVPVSAPSEPSLKPLPDSSRSLSPSSHALPHLSLSHTHTHTFACARARALCVPVHVCVCACVHVCVCVCLSACVPVSVPVQCSLSLSLSRSLLCLQDLTHKSTMHRQ